MDDHKSLRIGIVGAGFSGIALAYALYQLSPYPVRIDLFEKKPHFALGEAYSTPFMHHLLNVRACDMSAYESQPNHFVDWLKQHGIANDHPFLPRKIYGQYLTDLLHIMQTTWPHGGSLHLHSGKVIAADSQGETVSLRLEDQSSVVVDKAVLALGNGSPSQFPFTIHEPVHALANPWDYQALNAIPKQDNVLIVGTGLSMIDAVLTLHQQAHQGLIYAVSRHGLLPLPHTRLHQKSQGLQQNIPQPLNHLTKYLRQHIKQSEADWRDIMNELRGQVPDIWAALTVKDRKRFLRHILPYWNIHRHRVHDEIHDLLMTMQAKGQLKIIAARVLSVSDQGAELKLRHGQHIEKPQVNWVLNCMGPSLMPNFEDQPLIQQLMQAQEVKMDAVNIGLSVTAQGAFIRAKGDVSNLFYTLGPCAKSASWESSAVPEIRKQSLVLAKALLNI